MFMKIIHNRYWPCVLLICMVLVTIAAACVQPSQSILSPEAGMKIWIDAVNARDYHRLYALAPDSIRQQTNESAFIQAQAGNPLLADGSRITGYHILNQTRNGNNAAITVQLVLDIPEGESRNSSRKIPLYIKFIETFEQGEWKVWTTEP
jgi:hypothetical protein